MSPNTNSAERAGQAAATSRRRRRDRRRVVGGVVVLVVGVPLLFSCVWERLRLSEALRERDGLVSRRESMERTLLRLEGARSRLSTWERIAPLADRRLGLSAPAWGDVVWISVSGEAG